MEGRSYSPRPRKLDERHHREEWDRRREASPRTPWPPQGRSPEAGPAKVIIEGEGVLGFAKGRK
jgi:hypothetical protein